MTPTDLGQSRFRFADTYGSMDFQVALVALTTDPLVALFRLHECEGVNRPAPITRNKGGMNALIAWAIGVVVLVPERWESNVIIHGQPLLDRQIHGFGMVTLPKEAHPVDACEPRSGRDTPKGTQPLNQPWRILSGQVV